jgi:outer membrane protein assembly factor BamD
MTTRFISDSAFARRARLSCFAAAALIIAGCASHADKADRPDNPFNPGSDGPGAVRAPVSDDQLHKEALRAYTTAHDLLATGDYETAEQRLSALITRYPFTDFATQAELEKIYAQYRSFKSDEAITAADRFLREHPRHPHADYVQYVKGLIDSNRDNSFIDFLPVDKDKRDSLNARRAYDDFALLIQKYPMSVYANDARKRMLYLRNRIAAHELTVVKFYIKRGAWVAASKRAENIIFEYPGAPATADALLLLQQCYANLGLKTQTDEVRDLVAGNAASIKAANAPAIKTESRYVVAGNGAAGGTVTTQNAEPPKGFFGKVGAFVDSLGKTYTVNATTGTPDPSAPPSLGTGPYSGPDTVINVTLPKATETPAAGAAPAAATTQPGAAAEPKKKGGFFDFLNKTYTVGGKKDAAPAAAPVAEPAAPAAPAAAVTTQPVTAAPAATKPDNGPVQSTEGAKSKDGKGGALDFLNKTYTIGGKKPAAGAAPAAAAATPDAAANAAAATTEPKKKGFFESLGDVFSSGKTFTIHTKDGGTVTTRSAEEAAEAEAAAKKSGTGLNVSLDYEDPADADKKATPDAAAKPAPDSQPAK